MTSIRFARPTLVHLTAAFAVAALLVAAAGLAHGAKAKPKCFGKTATVVGTPGPRQHPHRAGQGRHRRAWAATTASAGARATTSSAAGRATT